jgi:hypothetical protein
MNYFLTIVFMIYMIYTLNFAIKVNRTNMVFNTNQRLLHNFLIWMIPFFWIMIIKAMVKPMPGSGKFKKAKPDGGFYESGIGVFGHNDGHDHTDHGHSNDD